MEIVYLKEANKRWCSSIYQEDLEYADGFNLIRHNNGFTDGLLPALHGLSPLVSYDFRIAGMRKTGWNVYAYILILHFYPVVI